MRFADEQLLAALDVGLPAAEVIGNYRLAQIAEAMPRLMQAELVVEACVRLVEAEPWLAPSLFPDPFEAAA